nr:MAG TPA: hypothetical protein [Caudoviricetes sp.]
MPKALNCAQKAGPAKQKAHRKDRIFGVCKKNIF